MVTGVYNFTESSHVCDNINKILKPIGDKMICGISCGIFHHLLFYYCLFLS